MTLQFICDIMGKNPDILDKEGKTVHVYEKVRAYMEENGYKQVLIAQKAGFSNATFNAILNGKRTLYSDDLRAICLALNVSPELFIEVKRAC